MSHRPEPGAGSIIIQLIIRARASLSRARTRQYTLQNLVGQNKILVEELETSIRQLTELSEREHSDLVTRKVQS